MRKELIRKMIQTYLRTFPPYNKNGNGKLANVVRDILAFTISLIGGGRNNTERLVIEILTEFEQSCK